MTSQQGWATVSVLAACLAGWSAVAGTQVTLEERDPASQAAVARSVFSLEPGRLRIETRTEEGETTLVIFHADQSVVWIIDPTEGRYYEMTPAKVAEVRPQMEAAQKEMSAELAKMPPEQRRALEQMMAQMGQGVGTPTPATVRVVGRGERVGSFDCVHYEVLRSGQRTEEVWAAPLEQLQLQREELETLAALSRLFEPLGSQGPVSQLSGLTTIQGGERVEGFPVRTLSYDNGQAYREEVVVRAERQSFDAKLFELPPGLRKTEFGEEE